MSAIAQRIVGKIVVGFNISAANFFAPLSVFLVFLFAMIDA
jgi:hypothetical protein